MADDFVSIAILEPFEGSEQEFGVTIEKLYALMQQKHYSRDELFRDNDESRHYIHIRHWSSAAARGQALEDPEVHRMWAQLGQLCRVLQVYKDAECVYSSCCQNAAGPAKNSGE